MPGDFGTHPLGRSVLGTAGSVGALTRAQMLDYFQHRYSPRNIALVATGRVDFEHLIESAQRYCGDWEPFEAPRPTPSAPPGGDPVIHKDTATQQYVVRISNGPASADPERYASRVLATILGDTSGSRMFWELFDRGLAEWAMMEACDFQGAGLMMTYLCCAPEDAASNLAIIEQIIADAHAHGVTTEELAQAKSKLRSNVVLQAERPANRLFSVGNNWLQRRQYRTVRETVQSYEAVTCADVAAVLARYPLTAPTTVAVGPLKMLPS